MATTSRHVTIDDLYRVPENRKAELVDGKLLLMPPTGDLPNSAAGAIYVSLRQYARHTGSGRAYTDNIGYQVNLPNRQSFSPDASFYAGPRSGGKFPQGAPLFAVEVRSEQDYGPRAKGLMAQKRADYFAAGTQVVWDVDVLQRGTVTVYRKHDPDHPNVYQRGEQAEAEPALPGWRLDVEALFE
jgi:Uma2 family endonuclease